MTLIPVRVGLQQRVFPDYRAPFFNLLAQACPQGFSLFSGLPRPEEAISVTEHLENGQYQRGVNMHISRGKVYFCMQSGLLDWLELWQPQVLIVEANPRYLSTPAAVRWMHTRHRPVLGWGLGAPDKGRLNQALRLPFLKLLDGMISYSQAGAEQYAACGIDPNKIFVAANAAAPKPARPAPQRPADYENGKARLLFVGRLQERKQLDRLFKACAALPQSKQPELTVVGDGPDRVRLESIAASLYPSTLFTGAKHGAELDAFFDRADLFVLPGTGGLAVQQAMAHALPVIVGQADGTQGELVRPENGWVLNSPDLETLTHSLADALSDISRLRRMGLASYRIVAEEVNLENMVASFAKAIGAVL